MLGLSGFYPKFVKKYVGLDRIIEKAVEKYSREVKFQNFQIRNIFYMEEKINSTEFKYRILKLIKKIG